MILIGDPQIYTRMNAAGMRSATARNECRRFPILVTKL